MRRLAKSKVMSKNTVTIPKAIREILEIKVGEYIDWYIENDRIIVRKSGSKR